MDIQDKLTSITTVAHEWFLVEALDLATLAHWTKVRRNLERSNGRHPFVSLPRNMHLTVHGDGIFESLSPPFLDLQELNGNVESAIAVVLSTTESQLPVTVKYTHGPPVPPPDTPLRAIGFGDSVLLYMDFSDNRKNPSPKLLTRQSLSRWDWFTVTAGNDRSASSYATKGCQVLEGALNLATSLEWTRSDDQLPSVSIHRNRLIVHDDGHVKSLSTPDTDLEVLVNSVESVTSSALPKTYSLPLVSVGHVQEPPIPPQDTPLRVIGFGNSVLLYMDFGDSHEDPSPKPSARRSSSRWDQFTVALRNRLSSSIYANKACGLLEDTLRACTSPEWTQSDGQLPFVSIPRDIRLTVHDGGQVKSLPATVANLEVLNEPVESVTAPVVPTMNSPSPISVVHVYEPPVPPDTPLRAIGFGDSVLLYIDFGDSHDDPSPKSSARRSSSRLNRITAPIRNFFRRLPFNFCSGRRH